MSVAFVRLVVGLLLVMFYILCKLNFLAVCVRIADLFIFSKM